MSIRKLVEFFDSYECLPILVNDVRDQIVSLGFQDEIEFHFVEIREEILRGIFNRYSYHPKPYASPIFHSDICIAKSLNNDWRRLVAAKELLHITDSDEYSAQSKQAVEKLLRNFSLPKELVDYSNSFLNDKMNFFFALAILVPKECRNILRAGLKERSITLHDAVNLANVPDRFVAATLRDEFEEIVEGILASL